MAQFNNFDSPFGFLSTANPKVYIARHKHIDTYTQTHTHTNH